MGPYQRTPKEGARDIRYSGLGVRSVGPVGDFLDSIIRFPLKQTEEVLGEGSCSLRSREVGHEKRTNGDSGRGTTQLERDTIRL